MNRQEINIKKGIRENQIKKVRKKEERMKKIEEARNRK